MGIWLIACAAIVYAMVVVGGVTRLTGSGLSMVRWHPVSGVLPPVGADAWQREFDAYRASPEYRLVNRGMSLAEFKRIFWMEYGHRMLGRGVGIAFLVPFLVFLAMRAIPRGMTPRLAGVFVLGGVQGVLGWYMVRSGLVDEPKVSQYRLAAHLSLAVLIYVYLLALALQLLGPRGSDAAAAARSGSVRWLTLAAGVSVFVTLVMGAFVAGLKAGYLHPTFPTMSGYWVPPGMFEAAPWWRSFFENPVTAQFHPPGAGVRELRRHHRGLGREPRGRRRLAGPVCGPMRASRLPPCRVGLGISTLLLHVPIPLAAGHQAGAIALLTCLVGLYLGTRTPRLAPASSAGRG